MLKPLKTLTNLKPLTTLKPLNPLRPLSHSSSHYPMYGKDSVTGYPCMTSSIASLR